LEQSYQSSKKENKLNCGQNFKNCIEKQCFMSNLEEAKTGLCTAPALMKPNCQ
jgi:hypothetical protein